MRSFKEEIDALYDQARREGWLVGGHIRGHRHAHLFRRCADERKHRISQLLWRLAHSLIVSEFRPPKSISRAEVASDVVTILIDGGLAAFVDKFEWQCSADRLRQYLRNMAFLRCKNIRRRQPVTTCPQLAAQTQIARNSEVEEGTDCPRGMPRDIVDFLRTRLKLSQADQELLTSRLGRGDSWGEVANRLGSARSTPMRRYKAILTKLRKLLARIDPERCGPYWSAIILDIQERSA